MRTPPAEVEIDAALIEALLAHQFPDLTGEVRLPDGRMMLVNQ